MAYNEGNAVEVPTFVRAVHQYWQWTGDDVLLRELYPFCKQGVLGYLLDTGDPDGNLCPSGRSIIENLEMHSGIECIDVAAYTWEALERLIDIATYLDDREAIADWRSTADALKAHIQTEWWLDGEGLFADARASTARCVRRWPNWTRKWRCCKPTPPRTTLCGKCGWPTNCSRPASHNLPTR